MRDIIFLSPWRNNLQWVKASVLSRIHDHTQTLHTRKDSYGRVVGPMQGPLPDNTEHPEETNIHAPGGFEPTIPASERPQTHALGRAATGTGRYVILEQRNKKIQQKSCFY